MSTPFLVLNMKKLTNVSEIETGWVWAKLFDPNPDKLSWTISSNDSEKSEYFCYQYTGSNHFPSPTWSDELNNWVAIEPHTGKPGSNYQFRVGRNPKNTMSIWNVQVRNSNTPPTYAQPETGCLPPNAESDSTAAYIVRPHPQGGSGDWDIVDMAPGAEPYYMWVWAQYDDSSPIVMCDPIIRNRN